MMPKKRKKPVTKRRRRVSGIDNGLMTILGAIAGGIGAAFLNGYLATMTKPVDPKLIAFAEVAGGGLAAWKLKGNPFVAGAGLGVAVIGSVKAGQSFGFIKGFRDMQVINAPRSRVGNVNYQLGSPNQLFRNAGPQVISGPNTDGSGNCMAN